MISKRFFRISLVLAAIVAFSFGLHSCKSDNTRGTTTGSNGKPKDTTTTKPKPSKIYRINADSAYSFVAAQVDFGPRVPGTYSHQKCANYLFAKLSSYADTTLVNQGPMTTYRNKVIVVKNIIGSFNPKAKKRILLAAHYDTRPHADEDPDRPTEPADGANDGASGVGVLLELARQMSIERPNVGVDIIFFDAEDGGMRNGYSESWCLGSQYWGDNPHIKNYSASYGILLDMVGASDAHFGYEAYSIKTAQSTMVNVWNVAQSLGHGNYFLNIMSGSITDDHVFVNQKLKIPMIDIIDYDLNDNSGFGDFWHTHKDNMSGIDKKTLNAVGETVLNVVMNDR